MCLLRPELIAGYAEYVRLKTLAAKKANKEPEAEKKAIEGEAKEGEVKEGESKEGEAKEGETEEDRAQGMIQYTVFGYLHLYVQKCFWT